MSRESRDAHIDEGWSSRLAGLLDEAVEAHGPDAVRAALAAELDRLAGPELLRVEVPVLGVDACPGGWVGVLLAPGARPAALSSRSIAALVELARESAPVAVVGIDIPIGLPDRGGRRADALAREALPGKGSSVFSTPTRSAYAAATYEDARARNVAATGGTSLSAQAWGLRAKVLDVDEWLRTRPAVAVIEVHPELSFTRMTGAPIAARKKDPEGLTARRTALEAAGLVPPAWFQGSGFGEDDPARRLCGRLDGRAVGSGRGPVVAGGPRGVQRRPACGDLGVSPVVAPERMLR